MNHEKKGFRKRAAEAAGDKSLEAKFRMVAERHGALRKFRVGELGNFEELRTRLNQAKEKILAGHDAAITRVKEQVEGLGGTVHLAADAVAARAIIRKIASAAGVKIVVKGKSMTSEEVELTPALEKDGIEVFETDLGEYIIQLAHERPSHIVIPAIHKTKADIAALFAEKLGMELTEKPEDLTAKAREVLRQKFLAADMGITGANAVIVENGTVVLLENEGNIRMSTTLPRVHVALAGIEKLLPSMSDLAVFLKLLSRSATGQKLSVYVSMIRGPGRPDERDGPREFHLVLLDNGRADMRRDPLLREALKCIRCGACINSCPVYQHIGGHAYGSVYPGPIGAMITSALCTGDEGWLLPFAGSLCGACTEVCAAKIPIYNILLRLRQRAAEGEKPGGAGESGPHVSFSERAVFRAWSELWSRPAGYRLSTGAAALAGRLMPGTKMMSRLPPPGSGWTMGRDFPAPAARPFHARWRPGVFAKSEKEFPSPREHAEAADQAEEAAAPALPRTGDPERLAREINSMMGSAVVVSGFSGARSKLEEFLKPYRGGSVVSWDHEDLSSGFADFAGAAASAAVEAAVVEKDDFSGKLIGVCADAAAGVTAADYALADSGTLVLLTRAGCERCLSLLPPVHIAVVRADRVLAGIDDLAPALARDGLTDCRGLTLVSGPSMTGDIEMMPVFGVHGPGKFQVIIVGPG